MIKCLQTKNAWGAILPVSEFLHAPHLSPGGEKRFSQLNQSKFRIHQCRSVEAVFAANDESTRPISGWFSGTLVHIQPGDTTRLETIFDRSRCPARFSPTTWYRRPALSLPQTDLPVKFLFIQRRWTMGNAILMSVGSTGPGYSDRTIWPGHPAVHHRHKYSLWPGWRNLDFHLG